MNVDSYCWKNNLKHFTSQNPYDFSVVTCKCRFSHIVPFFAQSWKWSAFFGSSAFNPLQMSMLFTKSIHIPDGVTFVQIALFLDHCFH